MFSEFQNCIIMDEISHISGEFTASIIKAEKK